MTIYLSAFAIVAYEIWRARQFSHLRDRVDRNGVRVRALEQDMDEVEKQVDRLTMNPNLGRKP